MKCTLIIDKEREEEVIIYAREPSPITERIIDAASNDMDVVGYLDGEATVLSLLDAYCFVSEGNRIYMHTQDGKYRIKLRLYSLEAVLSRDFVKINQSCIVNVRRIRRFGSTPGASLYVVLENGYKEYVSRRQIKAVKERIGIK